MSVNMDHAASIHATLRFAARGGLSEGTEGVCPVKPIVALAR